MMDLSWPLVIFVAWVAGEFVHRWTRLPRISVYGLVGFLSAHAQLGLLPASGGYRLNLAANVAFGLILFEFGYRINLRWLLINRWIGLTALLESVSTFAVVYGVARLFDLSVTTSMLLSALTMSTSPAALMRVVNEQRSSGQVTERALHLTAFNCLLAVFVYKVILGFWVFQSSGSLFQAVWSSLVVLVFSIGLGAVFGVAVPGLLRSQGSAGRDSTIAFALSVALLVVLTHAYKFSPVLATLTFGFVAKYRRVSFSQTQRNFGTLGDLLTIVLFVFVATTLEWKHVTAGAGLALVVVAARLVVKTVSVGMLAQLSGISWRKGILTGIALSPISVFVILILEQTRNMGIDLVDTLAPLAAVTLILEIVGPIFTQQALIFAGEAPET